jgi:hypothetical protein
MDVLPASLPQFYELYIEDCLFLIGYILLTKTLCL